MISELPTNTLLIIIGVLLVLSAFFSSSETALMALNRIKLKNDAKKKKGAFLAQKLLEKPDRLIGLILIGNNFINIAATALTTIVAIKIAGDKGVAYGTAILTFAILIFSEVTPKTYAALNPEKLGYVASYVLTPMLKLLYPIVWGTNLMTNGLLRLLGVPKEIAQEALSREELKTLVIENDLINPDVHQKMMINVMNLDHMNIEDVMVPRNEIQGININDDWEVIEKQLVNTYLTRLPVYVDNIDQVIGILHIRTILTMLKNQNLDITKLKRILRKPYFVPETASLSAQLSEFQRKERRMGLVVDEYGDLVGLVTLDDILEEIVGKFTSEPGDRGLKIIKQDDNQYLVKGRIAVRSLNRRLQWDLPTDEATTINGLITEYLKDLPTKDLAVSIDGYRMTIIETTADNIISKVLITPPNDD
ncbi:HlyC/CorC family transporter [Marinicella sp. S1101]|uniref:HlyC/CorC family transporter n=1 Tax=Marinicella marina TaxID=2996016 RepID=UPI00226097FC|nr:HlyC/CorC family transporter [Marinicella marina]MCX7554657.1 HlyC/CorC family transporter [Marinicella marina]MDJ1140722.1 HlyC/CorC family transporter [Marinicella marina]